MPKLKPEKALEIMVKIKLSADTAVSYDPFDVANSLAEYIESEIGSVSLNAAEGDDEETEFDVFSATVVGDGATVVDKWRK